MKIIILGCSPILTGTLCYNCSGYLVDSEILFDCGPGIWKALCQMSVPPSNMNNICLSHFHVDHTSDLPALLMARYLSPHIKNPIRIFGPPGLKLWFNKLTDVIGSWSRKLNIELNELRKSIMIGDYKLMTAPTIHTNSSICFRLVDNKKRVFFYSGDSDYDKNLVKTAHKADIAIIESSNTEKTNVKGHLTPERAAQIANEAQVKHLVLTHMYPEIRALDVQELVKRNFTGTFTLARDGLSFQI
jgi:ribonuclease BN (tRNA processing enzyme)